MAAWLVNPGMSEVLRALTIRFDPVLDRFDDAPIRDLLKDHRLISARDHFFEYEGSPRLALIVSYQHDETVADDALIKKRAAAPAEPRKEEWRKLLEPGDLPLFNTLREWRTTRARADGVPPYVICTNRQLATVVRQRPQSLAKLGEIDGFGRGKVERLRSSA